MRYFIAAVGLAFALPSGSVAFAADGGGNASNYHESNGVAPESQLENGSQTKLVTGNSADRDVKLAAGYHGEGSYACDPGDARPTRRWDFDVQPESISRGTEP
jgi:hypothetical protein